MDDRQLKKAVFERQNSPIFAPFMLNIACNLLNSHLQSEQISTTNIISNWGGGINQLRQCYPQWDALVNECCKTTPIDHNIWSKFLHHHNISNTNRLNPTQILKTLLSEWISAGHKNNTFGPYPSPYEQNEYQNVCPPMAHLSEAIVSLHFEPSFKANNAQLPSFDNDNQSKNKSLHQSVGTINNDKIVIPKDPFNYQKSANPNAGCIYYQTVHFTASQVYKIYNAFSNNPKQAPLILFGDNNIDKNRKNIENRIYSGGQAQVLGEYDRSIAFGIVTTWYFDSENNGSSQSYFQGQSRQKIPYEAFTKMMDEEFECLEVHIQSGRDLIVPSGDGSKFRHNLGTGIGNLSEMHLKYLQFKLDNLARIASKVESIDYCKDYKPRTMNENNEWNLSNLPMRKLLFDDNDRSEEEDEKQQSLYTSIHYESPQHRPANVQKNVYAQSQNYDMPRYEAMSTPIKQNGIKRVPHYKSPSGYVQNADEWTKYSSPKRQKRKSFVQSTASRSPMDGIGHNESYKKEIGMKEGNFVKKSVDFLLLILFCFPRRMYVALVVDNRPQDVFKLFAMLFVAFAILAFAFSLEVTDNCLILLCVAILCAIGGSDNLYGATSKGAQERTFSYHNLYKQS